MSVTVRAYTRKGRTDWEVDINVLLPNGERFRERRKSPASSKSASQRWGEDRERELLRAGPRQDKKEVPTLGEFASRFLDEHARANQQKPSGIAAKESILRVHLIPWLGSKRLDAITTPEVQALKRHLATRSPKTVNDTLTVLNTMLKEAVEWEVTRACRAASGCCRRRERPWASTPSISMRGWSRPLQRSIPPPRCSSCSAWDAGLGCGEMRAGMG